MRLGICLIAAAITMSLALVGAFYPAEAADEDIAVGDFYFCDSSFQLGVCETTITTGDTVTWTIASGFHTVTSCEGQTFTNCPPPGGFDSGQLVPSAEYQHTFDAPGTFYYVCNNHPGPMRGIITVEAQETTTPSPTAAPTATPVTGSTTPSPSAAETATPAGVPSTGGAPSGGSATDLAIAMLGALLACSALVVLVGVIRRDLRHF